MINTQDKRWDLPHRCTSWWSSFVHLYRPKWRNPPGTYWPTLQDPLPVLVQLGYVLVLSSWPPCLSAHVISQWHERLTSDTVSAIFSFVTTTANLLRATLETVNLFSISDDFAFRSGRQCESVKMVKADVPKTPISYSLLSISDSFWARNGSCAGSNDNLCTSDLIDPHSLLYLVISWAIISPREQTHLW